MTKKDDKNQNFIRSEYGWESQTEDQKMLREISNDNLTPKKHDFAIQNEIHSKIRNDVDYDDWEYGTEPLYEFEKP